MKLHAILIGSGIVAVVGGAGALAWSSTAGGPSRVVMEAEDGDDNESVIALADLPQAVREAALAVAGSAEVITQVERETSRGGVVSYGIEFTKDGEKWSADLSASGVVTELEEEGDEDD